MLFFVPFVSILSFANIKKIFKLFLDDEYCTGENIQ